jgi:mono/diheme cytochrome c family protein
MMRNFLVTAFVLVAVGAGAATQTDGGVADPNQALVTRYCATCHNQRLKTANVEFDTLELAHPEKNAVVWERAIRKLRGGMMPPPGAPRPAVADAHALAAYLETTLDKAAATNPNPGSVRIHRLNRAEYATRCGTCSAWMWRCRTVAQRRHQRGLTSPAR